ncbi:hypothetical protein KSX_64160 [Ktedonospora formicarum]|uniref:Uncharacterized protein n=1 Tax=Ktedonospora formicarum TaxID=2778364 RepID=A0A8J3MW24_9CHLR|nr:hypothetical protein KSX_64160 [Ktedonospora formicarum]
MFVGTHALRFSHKELLTRNPRHLSGYGNQGTRTGLPTAFPSTLHDSGNALARMASVPQSDGVSTTYPEEL